MYEAIFQSADRPFRATPDARFYFPNESIEQARQTLVRVVRRAEGPALVMGASGLGKSMLAQILSLDLAELFDIVKLHATSLCSRRALLQNILFELRLPYRELTEGELRLSLMDRMERSPDCAPKGLLIIVDEAHTLPVKLLEELRLITNFARDGEPRARLVLIGGLQLEETFARPQLDSFNQRLAARCYLQPMNRQQTQGFVTHQLRCMGVEPHELITRDALDAVHSASEGIPRIANQVMDHALVLAIASGQCPISAALIEEAWSDLQQLPAPWNGTIESQNSSPIEFGTLDDEDLTDDLETTSSDLGSSLNADFDQPHSIDISVDSVEVERPNFFAGMNSLPSQNSREPISISYPDEACLIAEDAQPDQAFRPSARNNFQPTENIDNLLSGPPRIVGGTSLADSDIDMLVVDDLRLGNPSNSCEPVATSPLDWIGVAATCSPQACTTSENFPNLAEAAETVHFPDVPVRNNALFGEDFDEEFEISINANNMWNKTVSQSFATNDHGSWDTLGRETEAVEQLAEMEESLHNLHVDDTSSETLVASRLDAIHLEADEQSWQVDTALTSGNVEAVLHEEIEDLISQLNFSAFSVDPVNVERISVDYSRSAAPAVGSSTDETVENEPTILSLNQDLPNDDDSSLDDDREMLIVEDDIPLSMKLSSIPNSSVRTEAQSYSRLFTKLRT